MTTIHDRIKQARLDKGLSMEGLAELVGLRSWQSIQQWENGATAPQRKRLEQVAAALGVTTDFLLRGNSLNKEDGQGADYVPVQLVDAKASAGKGTLIFSADDNKELMFRRSWLAKNGAKPGDVLAFPVDGDSMIDAHIPDGSVVLVNTKSIDPVQNRIYVLSVDSELMVKELIQISGNWYARSRNKEKTGSLSDIPIGVDDRVIGRAFWCGFKI
ncbi:LexA family transcriptional regulator [Alcaligenes faecalis]|nr:LexA family transcriptional regulator [Alcaligenes faecalis]